MKIIEPWSASESDRNQIERAAGALIGMYLTTIKYISPHFSTPRAGNSYAGFDTVLKGVELSSSSHALVAMWWMEGVKEGLGFVVDPDEQFYDDEGLQVVDVTHETQWAPMLKSAVVSSALSWHVPDDDAPKSVWSFRLDVNSGSSATIALGDVDENDGRLTYQPDSVAVIFDESIARRYRILASPESAWGVPRWLAPEDAAATCQSLPRHGMYRSGTLWRP